MSVPPLRTLYEPENRVVQRGEFDVHAYIPCCHPGGRGIVFEQRENAQYEMCAQVSNSSLAIPRRQPAQYNRPTLVHIHAPGFCVFVVHF